MFLSKRSNGIWYIHFKDEAGKSRSVSTREKRKSDAVQFLRMFKQSEHEKRRRVQHITLSDFKKEYLEYSKSIHTPNSRASAKSCLNEFQNIIGDKLLSQITIKDVEHFIAIKRKKSAHTARKHFVTVSAAIKKAVDWNYIAVNPFNKVTKPKLPEVPPLFFTKSDFQKLLSVIDNENFKQFVTVAVLSGLRLSELINLKWDAIDLIGKIIHVKNTEEFTTKSKKIRQVPMNESLYRIFAGRKETAVTELVFHRNMRTLCRHYVSKKFKGYVKASGVNPKLHFHSLRHTTASWMVQSGVSLYVVQQILGHSSIKVTEKYSHLEPTQLNDAMSKISMEVDNADR